MGYSDEDDAEKIDFGPVGDFGEADPDAWEEEED